MLPVSIATVGSGARKGLFLTEFITRNQTDTESPLAISPQHSAERNHVWPFHAETLSPTPRADTKLLRSFLRPPELPLQGKSKQGWIPAGLQQSQNMKHHEPSGDPLILLQHPYSSAAVFESFCADRCKAGFSLSDFSSSFKNYTALSANIAQVTLVPVSSSPKINSGPYVN